MFRAVAAPAPPSVAVYGSLLFESQFYPFPQPMLSDEKAIG